jgi:hypothetical protein
MAAVFGRARVAGQVIWAARFKERRIAGGGGKVPRSTSAAYSLSFAVAVCEGPIDGIGRVWADGKAMDMAGVVMRVHTGAEDQAPDPLIAAVENDAPAYRGTAYVVFEDLALGDYGNRPPQLSFEVFHRPRAATPGLEERLKGVCLIPGAGEFVYATDLVLRRDGLTRTTAETLNNSEGRADLMVSLDQLQAQLPNVEEVTLVVAWFGDDLRCGSCADPAQGGAGGQGDDPVRVAGERPGSRRRGGDVLQRRRPGLWGTPADRAVLQAIAELKRRGLRVTLYPFVLMDVPAGNTLPDPYGGAAQRAYPWRGRITCHPAAGRPGSPDKTAAASAQVSAFFGAATAGQFGAADGLPTYSGPAGDWGLRRMLLHYAKLAQLAGGVDGFILGSELRGLTTVRDAASSYPAVTTLKSLAGEVRSLLGPATKLGYAADWSEYFGHQPAAAAAAATSTSTSTRCGAMPISISSGSTSTRRWPTGARATTTWTPPCMGTRAGRTTSAICAPTSGAARALTGSTPRTRRERPRSAPRSPTAPMPSPGCSGPRTCCRGGAASTSTAPAA